MTYELIQSALTALINVTALAGLTGIIIHAFYTRHTDWMNTYCPRIENYTPESRDALSSAGALSAIAPEPETLCCPINPETYWDTASPDGSAWEHASPLTCEWKAPAKPKRRPKQQPSLAQDLGLEPPADWGKVQRSTTRKRKIA